MREGKAEPEVIQEPGWIISINIKLDKAGDRSMVFQTHVPQDVEREQINKLVDVAFAVGDRQVDAYRLVELKNELAINEKTLRYGKEDMQRVDRKHFEDWEKRGKRGDLKLNEREQAQRDNATTSMTRYEEEIAWQKDRIAFLQERMQQDRY